MKYADTLMKKESKLDKKPLDKNKSISEGSLSVDKDQLDPSELPTQTAVSIGYEG